ncbi:uncharacterized protein LY89DRAFT_683739 [Mollisia scopiformis]|uniref:Uncharacterized protein n=1 Tax=Mollisia scopiformis TaxID=149040 RepID=A0A194XFD0_MOLSC|nr:uncharacterized protein LY89DRAFT_683739 [Mollisia scopiformis]KUJ18900.1 hypothetical protein LY89DRAFT_683739 [Mollisia scopiformis]
MQFLTTATLLSLLFLSTSALPTALDERAAAVAQIDPSLVPIFSIKTGSGVGVNGVAIPKTCPPARAAFISKLSTNVAAGNVLGTPITFNTNPKVNDTKTNEARATAMIITLQSFTGVKGVGCPGASTPELLSQQKTGVMSPS